MKGKKEGGKVGRRRETRKRRGKEEAEDEGGGKRKENLEREAGGKEGRNEGGRHLRSGKMPNVIWPIFWKTWNSIVYASCSDSICKSVMLLRFEEREGECAIGRACERGFVLFINGLDYRDSQP